MHADSALTIFINTAIINNFVLAAFLGMCPFFGVTRQVSTAGSLGLATAFVILISSVCAFAINIVLTAFELEFLRLISYIAIIASAVQLLEMAVKKYFPVMFRALGIYLPLITTNCAVLGVALFQTSREYNLIQSVAYALGGGLGFTFALLLMAGLREKMEFSDVPSIARGTSIALMIAGCLSLAFMGFAGLGGH